VFVKVQTDCAKLSSGVPWDIAWSDAWLVCTALSPVRQVCIQRSREWDGYSGKIDCLNSGVCELKTVRCSFQALFFFWLWTNIPWHAGIFVDARYHYPSPTRGSSTSNRDISNLSIRFFGREREEKVKRGRQYCWHTNYIFKCNSGTVTTDTHLICGGSESLLHRERLDLIKSVFCLDPY